VADINLNIALSVQEAAKNIEKLSQQAAKSLGGIEKSSEKANESLSSISKSTSIVGQAFSTFLGNVATQAVNKLTDSAKALFNTFIVQGVGAYQEQEDAVAKLNSSLLAQGDLSKDVQGALLEQAAALQSVTKFGDETIIGVQALIANLTDLEVNGIKRTTEATLNFASALGVDAETAATTISKALEGNVGALKRYGISVKAGATDTETFNNVLGALEQRFGSASEAAVQTFSGAMAQLKNTFGDLQEETGALIAQNPAVIAGIAQVSSFFQGLTKVFIENKKPLSDFVSQLVVFAGETVVFVIKSLDFLQTQFTNIAQGFSALTNVFAVGIAKLTGQNETFIQSLNEVYEEDTKKRYESLEARKQVFAEVQALAEKSVAQIEAAALKEQEIANTKFQADQERETIKTQLADQKRIEDEEKRQVALEKEINDLITHNENLKAIDGNKYAEQISANQRLIDDKARQLQDGSNREIAIERKLTELKRQELNARLNQAGTFFGNLATLSQTGNKELFEIGKIAAIAQAVVSGATAINNALAVPPYPVGVALAASAAVAAGVQIATISAQKLATGMTEIPKGFNNDSFPALLSSGERVISVPQNQDLKSFMEEERGSRSMLASIAEKLDMALNRPIVIEINGREVFRAVSDELSAGRAFA
jgi:hypothetical protein